MGFIFKKFFSFIFCVFSMISTAQVIDTDLLKPDPEKEKKFYPYLAIRHGGIAAAEEWKKSNTYQYYKELWYYCESFYIKRNYFESGVAMNDYVIDISRFEKSRKEKEESVITLEGYKDVIVLLPAEKLIYKP